MKPDSTISYTLAMKIGLHGDLGEVTGSRHLLEAEGLTSVECPKYGRVFELE